MKRRMRFPEVTVPIGLYCTYRYKRLSEESSFRAFDRGLRVGRARVVRRMGLAAWDLQRGLAGWKGGLHLHLQSAGLWRMDSGPAPGASRNHRENHVNI